MLGMMGQGSWPKLTPSWSQVGPKLAPSGPKLAPSWPVLGQVGANWIQVGPSWPEASIFGRFWDPSGSRKYHFHVGKTTFFTKTDGCAQEGQNEPKMALS